MRKFSFAKLIAGVVLGSFLGTIVGVGYVAHESSAVLKAVAPPVGLTSAGSVAITGGNVAYVLSKSAIPFIKLPSGSMGNNGAVTALTALPRTYSNGAWAWVPAGAVAAGVPAAASWLWFVGSSGTAGTVYNSTYTTGTPTIGTTTAFVTTGPGAFTGDTGEVFGPTITVPAGALGANGQLRIWTTWECNNTAGAKNSRIRYSGNAGTVFAQLQLNSNLVDRFLLTISNTGLTNAQIGSEGTVATTTGGTGANAGSVLQTAVVDTTAATTLVLSQNVSGVATDYSVGASYVVEVLQ